MAPFEGAQMFQISSLVTAMMAALSGVTVWQLWSRRAEIMRDDLRDEERTLAWRVVLFLVMPLLVAIDLRATEAATTWAGGWLKDVDWKGWWYSALPQELTSVDFLIPVLFAGVVAQFILGLSLLPSLAFRPHPFVACVIVYLVAAIFGLNLIVDPLAAAIGCGSYRWALAFSSAPHDQVVMLVSVYLSLSVVLLVCIKNRALRLWFAELSRPEIGEQLRIAICETRAQPHNCYPGQAGRATGPG